MWATSKAERIQGCWHEVGGERTSSQRNDFLNHVTSPSLIGTGGWVSHRRKKGLPVMGRWGEDIVTGSRVRPVYEGCYL